MDLESIAILASMSLKWAQQIALGNQMLLDHRNSGAPIDFTKLQAADDESRKSLVAKVEAKRQREAAAKAAEVKQP